MEQPDRLSVPHLPAPCFVVHGLGVGGSQVATLRYLALLPEWVRERAMVWVPDWPRQTWPLIDNLPGDLQRKITSQMPKAVTQWVMSNGEVRAGMPRLAVLCLRRLSQFRSSRIFGFSLLLFSGGLPKWKE